MTAVIAPATVKPKKKTRNGARSPSCFPRLLIMPPQFPKSSRKRLETRPFLPTARRRSFLAQVVDVCRGLRPCGPCGPGPSAASLAWLSGTNPSALLIISLRLAMPNAMVRYSPRSCTEPRNLLGSIPFCLISPNLFSMGDRRRLALSCRPLARRSAPC